MRLSYASEHQSLAMLEYFVHLDKDEPPGDLVLAAADIPEELEAESIDRNLLPENWRDAAAPAELAQFGNQFAKRAEICLLWIPSVLAPNESNCLLNPAHADFRKIVVRPVEPLNYDSRMFRKPRRKH
jgi:RES domain-containing protein